MSKTINIWYNTKQEKMIPPEKQTQVVFTFVYKTPMPPQFGGHHQKDENLLMGNI